MHKLDGYKSAFANGKTGKGKGVAVFFRDNARIETCEEELYQFIKFENEDITIFCLYISKGCEFKQLIQSLESYEFSNNGNTCLIGDLNFDANGNNEFTRYMSELQFTQIVKRATHLDGHILDQVYVPQRKSHLFETNHHFVYYSDHDGILVDMNHDDIQ